MVASTPRKLTAVTALAVAVAACGGGAAPAPADSSSSTSSSSTTPATTVPTTPTTTKPPTEGLPLCSDVGYPTAPDDWYADEPIYVGDEMPVEEIRAFASDLDGYENIWIDREHNGWVAVGFVGADVEAHQAVLEERFPGVGVVAVEMPHTRTELERVRQRIDNELPEAMSADNVLEVAGVVEVWVGRLTPQGIAAAEAVVGDAPACLSGQDPATTPEPGPQPSGGEGWEYLTVVDSAIQDRPVVVADQASLQILWNQLGLEGSPPEVDFEASIVVGFAVFYSGSCPETRFDDIVVRDDLVLPVISHVSTEQACTDDANPRTYLVALEREVLPAPPFRMSYEKGTVLEIRVMADLRQPGAVPAEGEIEDITTEPSRTATPLPLVIETGFPRQITIDVACGIDYLGIINDVGWYRSEDIDDVPAEWQEATVDGLLDVEVLLEAGPEPRLTATAGGRDVVYLPGPDQGAPCD